MLSLFQTFHKDTWKGFHSDSLLRCVVVFGCTVITSYIGGRDTIRASTSVTRSARMEMFRILTPVLNF